MKFVSADGRFAAGDAIMIAVGRDQLRFLHFSDALLRLSFSPNIVPSRYDSALTNNICGLHG